MRANLHPLRLQELKAAAKPEYCLNINGWINDPCLFKAFFA